MLTTSKFQYTWKKADIDSLYWYLDKMITPMNHYDL